MLITKKPYLVSFAGNPIRYQLETETSPGTFSVIEIRFTALDTTPGHAMTIAMMGGTRTFTLRMDPTTKDDLPVADDNWTLFAWAQHCFNYLLDDPQIVECYDISVEEDENNDGLIILTAKTCSPEYDWSTDSNNITTITVTTSIVGEAAPAVTVDGVKMSILKNGTEKIGEDYKPLDSDGIVKFEIQEYIYAALLQVLPPRFNLSRQDNFQIFYDYFIKYHISFCNRIAGVYEERNYGDPENPFCYALAGGLNREDLVANNLSQTDYFNLTATKKKFLSWSPATRITDKIETHSLFFVVQDPACPTIQLKASMYSKDSSTTAFMTPELEVVQFAVYEFMAGYGQLALNTVLSGGVIAWELYLVDENGTVVSDIRRFELDEKYYENVRYFRFRNSWGTYDSLRCTGVFENIVEHDREKVIFMSDEVETSFNSPGAYSIVKEAQSFKANSGWLDKEFINYLRDFMLSGDIFEVDGTRLLKCLLTSKKTSMFKDGNYNYNLAFEYERAYDDFFFQGLD